MADHLQTLRWPQHAMSDGMRPSVTIVPPLVQPVTIGQVTRVLLTAMRDGCQDTLDLIAAHGMQARYGAPPADEGTDG